MRESIRWRMNGGVVKLKNNSFEWIYGRFNDDYYSID